MNQEIIQGQIISERNIQREDIYSQSTIPQQYPNYNKHIENYFPTISYYKQPQSQGYTQNNINSSQQYDNSSFYNIRQDLQMQDHNSVHQDTRSNSTSSLNNSNKQSIFQSKQHNDQRTSLYKINKNNNLQNQSNSSNQVSQVDKNHNDLQEFEKLEQQIKMQNNHNTNNQESNSQVCQIQKMMSENIQTNNTDQTAQEIQITAESSQTNSFSGDKTIKMKPSLKKSYMSLEQLQMKCQTNNQIENKDTLKNQEQYGYNIQHENKNQNINQQLNINKKCQNQDKNQCHEIQNKFKQENSEQLEQYDSLQNLLERAFKSKIKHEQSTMSDFQLNQSMTKNIPPIQLEKQILGSLPPPSPISLLNQSQSQTNTQKSATQPSNKIQQQFQNVVEQLKKNKSTNALNPNIEGNNTMYQDIFKQKTGSKIPTTLQSTNSFQSQNNGIQIDFEIDKEYGSIQKHQTPTNPSQQDYYFYVKSNQNHLEPQSNNKTQSSSEKQIQIDYKLQYTPLNVHKSNSTNFIIPNPVQQQRSISYSTAQDFPHIQNRRNSSRRMSSKGSIGSIDLKRQEYDFIKSEMKGQNLLFNSEYDQDFGFKLSRSLSNQKPSYKNNNQLFERLNQDLERRKVILEVQMKQKEMKNRKSLDDLKKQNLSKGKLSKDEEKNLVNKLYDDANRRQKIQVMQQKIKKIEEEQREKSIEAQREHVMKRNASFHNSSQYANVQKSKSNNLNRDHSNRNEQYNSHSPIQKHSLSKKNQHRTISPILKRSQHPLQTSESKSKLNKTQLALKQFQFDNFENTKSQQKVNIDETRNQGNNQSNKANMFIDNIQLQFYTPNKQVVNDNFISINKTYNKSSGTFKSSTQLNNTTNQQNKSGNKTPSHQKQHSIQESKHNKNNSFSNLKIVVQSSSQERNYHDGLYEITPQSISSIKKPQINTKSNLDNINEQKKIIKNIQFNNKENGNGNQLKFKESEIIKSVSKTEYKNNQNQQNSPQKAENFQTPSHNKQYSNQQHNQTNQHNNSAQTYPYISMKCTNSFFKEKNPSTLSQVNQNFQKINKQMSYQYINGSQTSKNSSANQSSQQSMKNSEYIHWKTPNSTKNNEYYNNMKSQYSFGNQYDMYHTDDQKFSQSKQNKYDTIKINISSNKAQIIDNNSPISTQQQLQQDSLQNNEKQQKVESINKFIQENPNFIQFMIEQYHSMQKNNEGSNVQSIQSLPSSTSNKSCSQLNSQQFLQYHQQQLINNQQQSQNTFSGYQQTFNKNSNLHQMQINNQHQIQSNKILTVDQLLDLDEQPNQNYYPTFNNQQILSQNSSNNPKDDKDNLFDQIFQSETNPVPKDIHYLNSNDSNLFNGQSFNQQQKVFKNYQIQNIYNEDEEGKIQGSFQNLINSSQLLGKSMTQNNQYLPKSSNSLEYLENDTNEQNTSSIHNLKQLMKSQNTFPSINFIEQKSSNSTLQITSNSTIQKSMNSNIQKTNNQCGYSNVNNNNSEQTFNSLLNHKNQQNDQLY